MKYDKIESINWEKEFPEVPECVHDALGSAAKQILAKKQRKIKVFPKKRMLLLVAAITLLSGMTVMAAGYWQQRMEAMNREELEKYFLSVAANNAPAFRYNRAMTEEENALFEELNACYENEGLFPKGALTMISDADEYKGKGVAYDKKSSTFFLPEKEMSEEQLLQIIDFYHKVEYSVVSVNQLADEEEIQEMVKDEVKNMAATEGAAEVNAEVPNNASAETAVEVTTDATTDSIYHDYKPINNAASYYEIPMQGEEILIDIAAGNKYLYLGFKTEIKRVPLGSDSAEEFYELAENESVFAINSDKHDNVYLSIYKKDETSETATNRLVRINADGQVETEYDLKNAVYGEKTADVLMVDNMLADENGQLYVKCRWGTVVLLFVFDAEGNYIDKIVSEEYIVHGANEMCFGQDGYLYQLGQDALVKIDTDSKEVVESYNYCAEEMIAAVNMVYPIDENSFSILSYDGLFRYTIGEEASTRVIAPYETEIFAEGMRHTPVSEDSFVIVNMTDYENFKYKITYVKL